MAKRSYARRPARRSGPVRRSRVSRGYVGGRARVSRPRRRSVSGGRAQTVRVVVQSAPAPIVASQAVSMTSLRKAKF